MLVAAPTGSGKTFAAFLAAIDQLVKEGLESALPDETRIVYVSPLKALSNDIHRNLEAPLEGIGAELRALGLPDVPIRAAVRTGDTPQAERARMRRTSPHIVVTTPESLYILLTSSSGREMLSTCRTVIVDEIHAIAGNKRGAHLALSLERLQAIVSKPLVRIGLSATQKPIEEVARFLTGSRAAADAGRIPSRSTGQAPCIIIDAGHTRRRDLALELPPAPLEAVMSGEVWTQVYDRLAELTREHRTTLVFVNTRRLAERVARHLSERIGEENVAAHHGSLARDRRLDAEQRLKRGELKALVATASLELGIDIGDVDLVCQIGSTRSINAFLQRVGRAGHSVGGTSKGRLFPLSRDELVECTALLDAVRRGELDRLTVPQNALDVLTQQIAAEVSAQEWREDALFELAARRLGLPRSAARGIRRVRRHARRGLQHAARAPRRADPSRLGARHAAAAPRGPPDRDHLRRRHPGQRRLPGDARAGVAARRHRERGLCGRESAGRCVPTGQYLVPDLAGRARYGAGRGCARRAAVDSVLAGRGPGTERRAVRGRLAPARGDGAAPR